MAQWCRIISHFSSVSPTTGKLVVLSACEMKISAHRLDKAQVPWVYWAEKGAFSYSADFEVV
ncbi:MAG: hypothetical protein ACLU18_17090 [Bacteroides thetaiotaomicron]